MSDRYAITIQNPKYELSVFVWDRQAKEVLVSFSYPELTADAQRAARRKCEEWIKARDERA